MLSTIATARAKKETCALTALSYMAATCKLDQKNFDLELLATMYNLLTNGKGDEHHGRGTSLSEAGRNSKSLGAVSLLFVCVMILHAGLQ